MTTIARILAGGRCLIGLALIAAPRRITAGWIGEDPGSVARIPTQALGAREVAIGLGTLQALRVRPGADTRRWLLAGIVSDLADAAVTGFSDVPPVRRAAIVALAASGAVTGVIVRSRS